MLSIQTGRIRKKKQGKFYQGGGGGSGNEVEWEKKNAILGGECRLAKGFKAESQSALCHIHEYKRSILYYRKC